MSSATESDTSRYLPTVADPRHGRQACVASRQGAGQLVAVGFELVRAGVLTAVAVARRIEVAGNRHSEVGHRNAAADQLQMAARHCGRIAIAKPMTVHRPDSRDSSRLAARGRRG